MASVTDRLRNKLLTEFAKVAMTNDDLRSFEVEVTEGPNPYNPKGVKVHVSVKVMDKYPPALDSVLNYNSNKSQYHVFYYVFVSPAKYEPKETEMSKVVLKGGNDYLMIANYIVDAAKIKMDRLGLSDKLWAE